MVTTGNRALVGRDSSGQVLQLIFFCQEAKYSQMKADLMYGLPGSSREDWNEDWAIVDGAGYFDFQELEEGL